MIAALLIALGYTYVFYIGFIATMGILRAWPGLSWPVRVLTSPVALIALGMDLIFNLLFATVLLLDWPREATFTQRLNRYKAGDSGWLNWRTRVAVWICRYMLDPFQQGGHCRG